MSRWMAGTTALREDNEVFMPNALQHVLIQLCLHNICGVSEACCVGHGSTSRPWQMLDADMNATPCCQAC